MPRSASRALVFIGRGGLAGRGLIYFTIGVLAVLAAFGFSQGEATDEQGAAATIDQLPLGSFLLIVAGIGLAGYALWRLTEAGWGQARGGEGDGIGKRILLGLDGLFHGFLAFIVFSVATGSRQGNSEEQSDHWTATVLAQPFGRWLVVLGGLAALLGGAFLVYRGLTRDFTCNLRACAAGWPTQAIRTTGRFGESARAVVFMIIGVFLLRAGWQHDAEETRGLAGALHALAGQPLGWLWLSIIAFGFVAYGLYSFLVARYRQIGPA